MEFWINATDGSVLATLFSSLSIAHYMMNPEVLDICMAPFLL